VLVVDDEPDTLDVLQRVLTAAGGLVRTADTAAAALELCRAEAPDLLLSDIGMPVEDGYSLIRSVRRLTDAGGAPLRIPAVALTAFARSEDRTRVLLAGYQAHLAKPVDPDELIATLASVCGGLGTR